jgi:aminoglycoside phosphotransferase (APT) family kinase protein
MSGDVEMKNSGDSRMDEWTAKIVRWLERNVGGKLLSITPQARWRPVWFAEIDRAGERISLCVRGDRIDVRHGFPLEHEMKLQQQLHAHGIPVPKVWGWCDDPRAYVVDRIEGVDHFDGVGETERDAIMDQYMEILARIHALDIQPFADVGIMRADRPQDSGRLGMGIYERAYRAAKKRPDPHLEFCLAWLARNPLGGPVRESVIVWDSGQFLHQDGRIRSLVDLEIGHIGDPMMDLGAFRMRLAEFGYRDFDRLYRRYEEARGQPVDRDAVRYYHFAFTLSNQLAFHAALADPPPGSDYMMNLRWCTQTNIYSMEALAEILGIELADVPLPDPRVSSAAIGHAHLVDWLRHFEARDDYAQHEVRIFFRLARHLQRSDEIGEAIERADLDDIEPLLDHRPSDWREADAALERFVLADEGRHDAELARMFHRRLQRQLMALGPAGSAIARHIPLPGFR